MPNCRSPWMLSADSSQPSEAFEGDAAIAVEAQNIIRRSSRRMGEIAVTTRSGQTYKLAIEPGVSLMQSIRDAGINEVLALCGGCCACGTCHVYVDPAFEQFLPPIGSDEKGLLDYADH